MDMQDRGERFSDSYAKTVKTVFLENAHREIYYKTLLLVRDQSDELALRDAMLALPEMKVHLRTPRFYLDKLADAGALVRTPLPLACSTQIGDAIAIDAAAVNLAAADAATARPAAVDAAPADGGYSPSAPEHFAWTLSDVGSQLIADLSPALRLEGLFGEGGRDIPVFRGLLAYCSSPRTRAEIESMLAGAHLIDGSGLAASYFLDKLESHGGLVWDGGWKTTDEGRRFLEKSPGGC